MFFLFIFFMIFGASLEFAQKKNIQQKKKVPEKVTVYNSLGWGRFAGSPAAKMLKDANELNEHTAQLLVYAYHNMKADDYALANATLETSKKVGSFSQYYTKYKKAKNEFEKRRFAKEEREVFEKDCNDVKIASESSFFFISILRTVGEYSFEKKQFPMKYTTYFPFAETFDFKLLNLKIGDDLFIPDIAMNEKDAERVSSALSLYNQYDIYGRRSRMVKILVLVKIKTVRPEEKSIPPVIVYPQTVICEPYATIFAAPNTNEVLAVCSREKK